MTGSNCDVCLPQTFGFDALIGCEDCNCDAKGVVAKNLECDINSGECKYVETYTQFGVNAVSIIMAIKLTHILYQMIIVSKINGLPFTAARQTLPAGGAACVRSATTASLSVASARAMPRVSCTTSATSDPANASARFVYGAHLLVIQTFS